MDQFAQLVSSKFEPTSLQLASVSGNINVKGNVNVSANGEAPRSWLPRDYNNIFVYMILIIYTELIIFFKLKYCILDRYKKNHVFI